jgi:hypothetical protein
MLRNPSGPRTVVLLMKLAPPYDHERSMASALPARRAARVDPAEVLRWE